MVNDLAIYGAGGLGREMALLIDQINQDQKRWNFIGYFDDRLSKGVNRSAINVLGSLDELNVWKNRISVLIAVADPVQKFRLTEAITNNVVQFPSFIHPLASIGSVRNTMGAGSVITAGCILTTDITIGSFVLCNLSTTIGHDCLIGDHASIMPGVNISGTVSVGRRCLIGTGAKILQNLTIGDGAIVGAGAVVINNVEADSTVVGVPAKKIT